jgi:hypothetical protein
MRYLVRARVKQGGERSLLQAIEHRTLGKGSVAGGEYLRNMQAARLCPDAPRQLAFARQPVLQAALVVPSHRCGAFQRAVFLH